MKLSKKQFGKLVEEILSFNHEYPLNESGVVFRSSSETPDSIVLKFRSRYSENPTVNIYLTRDDYDISIDDLANEHNTFGHMNIVFVADFMKFISNKFCDAFQSIHEPD